MNIAEILEDCPKGTELYSPLCGKCYFDRLNYGTIICKKRNAQEITFTSEGYYMLPVFEDAECMLFPSKENRDWDTFQRPFQNGDIVSTVNGMWIGIVKRKVGNAYETYTTMYDGATIYNDSTFCFERLAPEPEKQKLFDTIKKNGYKWNPETKTLEKLIKPKFKVGDRIKHSRVESGNIYTVVDTKGSSYTVNKNNEKHNFGIDFEVQDDWELVPNKFDISTLKPFKKVLVRDTNGQVWTADFFSHILNSNSGLRTVFVCLGHCAYKCIPYNDDTKHLLGTNKDCDDYYKTWE